MENMNNDAWFRFFTADFKAGTCRMLNDEIGAYMRLLCDYYINGPLPNNTDLLCQIACVNPVNWARIWGVVGTKFTLIGDKFHNRKADEEIEWRKQQYERRLHQTEAALKSRGLKNKHVTCNVTSNVTSDVTYQRNIPQNQNQNHNQSTESESESEPSTPRARVEKLRSSLSSMFRRPDSCRWSYEEESTLAEVARRDDCLAELEAIRKHRASVPKEEQRFLKGRDIAGLLRDWTSALDQARSAAGAPSEDEAWRNSPDGKHVHGLLIGMVKRMKENAKAHAQLAQQTTATVEPQPQP